MIVWLAVTVTCILLIGRGELTALGRVVVVLCWLALTALWVSSASAQPTTPTPSFVPTPHATFPITTCRPPTTGAQDVDCCFVWKPAPFWSSAPGGWWPINCVR